MVSRLGLHTTFQTGALMANDTAYTFTYGDLAKAIGVTKNTIAQHRLRKHFDPTSIESIAVYLARYGRQELREQIIMAVVGRNVPKDPGGWKRKRRRQRKTKTA